MTSIKDLHVEVGELLSRHDRGRSLVTFRKYADDPVGFIREVLGGEPWPAQVEIAESFRDDALTVVRSCNGAGKDWVAARLALWWAYARGGLAILTGPTLRQVKEIVMGEVRAAWERTDGLPGELFEMALRLNRSRPSGIIAFTSTEASRKTGFHAPALAVLITEAQGVEDSTYEAALANATGEESRILAVGNPLQKGTRFYGCFRSEAWRKHAISAFDHPNVQTGEEGILGAVTTSYVKRIRQEYGETSSVYQARVLGEFPDSAEDQLVTWHQLEAAQERYEEGTLHDAAREKGVVVGVDVARYGADKSVAAVRRGPVVKRLVTWQGASTTESVRKVRTLVTSIVAGRRDVMVRGVDVVVDEVGLGGGVVDGLKDLSRDREYLRVHGFQSQATPEDTGRYHRARDEAFWKLRRLLEAGEVALPPDPELAEELAEHRWSLTSEGRIRVEPKSEIQARIGRSPDKADAVAMALYREEQVQGVFIGGFDDDMPDGWTAMGPPVASAQIPLR